MSSNKPRKRRKYRKQLVHPEAEYQAPYREVSDAKGGGEQQELSVLGCGLTQLYPGDAGNKSQP